MNETVANVIQLLVGIALFITGMSMMSSGLKKLSGRGVRRLFNKIKDNRFAGVGIGAATTALIQSSGATSVMTIGFLNAGVMTIFQGLCIILGGYIGTTITGLLVSLSSFPFATYLLLLAVVGVILSFFKSERLKNIGELLTGLGVLFFGLETMKDAFNGDLLLAVQNMFAAIAETPISPVLLMLIGAAVTAVVQSSSATTGIVIVMVGSGATELSSAFYVVLGATIGTVIVTLIASVGGSINAKRTAWACLFIRITTALMALAILWPVESLSNNGISNGLLKLFDNNAQITVAMFLIFYNIIFVGVLLPFIKPIEKFSTALIHDRKAEKQKSVLKYIDDRLLITPSLALGQAKNEIINMLELSRVNLGIGFHMITRLDFEKKQELLDREDNIDYINNALTNFLIALSHDVSLKEEKKVGSYFHIINDIERIGDHAYNFYELANKMYTNDLHFSEKAVGELDKMYNLIEEMFRLTNEVFIYHDSNALQALHEIEGKTDVSKKSLNDAHYERISKNECVMELSPFYTSLVSELERVADHLVNIGYAHINPTGDEEVK
ncbi:MAG: Na/Pi cotransporter family protein [Bacilli bacterium]|nr:Na/Pi cotransporter family protein [Bacilli bacterium]